MKKVIFGYKSWGTKHSIDFEIHADINRELTDNDHWNIREYADKMIKALMEETIKLDPNSKLVAEQDKKDILSLFGDRSIFVDEIPNGYCSEYCCKHLPWFIVTTKKGRIKIGWRKRVIHIDWEDSIIKEDADTLFPDEDVTKFGKGIHAWGLDKAKEYIDILLK